MAEVPAVWCTASATYQSQVDKEAGILSGFWQVRQKDGDTKHKNEEILTYLSQCLNTHCNDITIN